MQVAYDLCIFNFAGQVERYLSINVADCSRICRDLCGEDLNRPLPWTLFDLHNSQLMWCLSTSIYCINHKLPVLLYSNSFHLAWEMCKKSGHGNTACSHLMISWPQSSSHSRSSSSTTTTISHQARVGRVGMSTRPLLAHYSCLITWAIT